MEQLATKIFFIRYCIKMWLYSRLLLRTDGLNAISPTERISGRFEHKPVRSLPFLNDNRGLNSLLRFCQFRSTCGHESMHGLVIQDCNDQQWQCWCGRLSQFTRPYLVVLCTSRTEKKITYLILSYRWQLSFVKNLLWYLIINYENK